MKIRIATLGAALFTVLAIGSTGLMAQSVDLEKYQTITEVELYETTDGRETFVSRMPVAAPSTVPTEAKKDAPKPTGGAGGVNPGDIISIGTKIWEIIEKNRPVVTQNYQAISAVPAGITKWDELQDWSEPSIRVFKLEYKNVYKMKVVVFNFRVAYTANGTYNGVGKYLSRVEIDPSILNVAWGYKFNAAGEALNITNVGTKEAPIAAMEIRLNWSVDTALKHMQESVRFYIRGDGLFKNISDGTMPSENK